MGLRFVLAPPVLVALRSSAVCLAICAAVGCAGGKGSPTGSGGSSAGGKTGTGAAGTTGSGNAGTTGTGNAGTTGSGNAGTTGSGNAGTTGSGNAGTNGSGTAGTNGAGGTTPPAVDAAVSDAACQSASYTFTPTTPTVYLLVDRSGSMFHCLTGSTGDAVCADMTNTSWYNLKTAIESVLPQLETQVRFGFATVWGTNPAGSGGMCPSLQGMLTNNVGPALNNAGAIKTLYDGLVFPPNSTQVGIKFESPASESLGVVAKTLMADATPGSKNILFITDGQPDYCDDSNSLCAPDSVIWQIQNAYTAGISTIVLGVQTSLFDLAPGTLQAWANAGAGEPTLPPVKTGGSVNDFYDECNSIAGWATDLTASAKPKARGTTLGTYATTMGATKPYTPSASDKTQLVTQLSAAISGVKSCSFDLSDVNGKSLKVDTTKLAQAHIKIEGTAISLDPANGWNIDPSAPSQLVLSGTACATWRMPNNNNIEFAFPCTTIIFE